MSVKQRSSRPLSKAKLKAWNAFSLYIRTRDCLKAGNADRGSCVTCRRVYPRTGIGCLQAGHFVAGRTNAILFDERNCHAQCMNCNVYQHSNPHEYWLFMEKEYGREVINELIANKGKALRYTTYNYQQIADMYSEKTKDLLKGL